MHQNFNPPDSVAEALQRLYGPAEALDLARAIALDSRGERAVHWTLIAGVLQVRLTKYCTIQQDRAHYEARLNQGDYHVPA